jgi:hypothetical protein
MHICQRRSRGGQRKWPSLRSSTGSAAKSGDPMDVRENDAVIVQQAAYRNVCCWLIGFGPRASIIY